MTDISEQGFTYSMPDLLVDQVKFSKVYVNYGVMEKETSFGIDMSIAELSLAKTLRSRDLDLLPGKVEATLSGWEKKYQRHLEAKERERKEANIDELNTSASSKIETLNGVLAHTLDINDEVDWDSIKITGGLRVNAESLFDDGLAPDFINFDESGQPVSFKKLAIKEKPTLDDVKSEFGIFSQTFRGAAIKGKHEEQTGKWTQEELKVRRTNDERKAIFKEAQSAFKTRSAAFEEEKRRNNQALENIRERYQNSEPKAVEEYCDLVLDSSIYPDYFPKNWLLGYLHETKTVITNYEIPSPDQLPSTGSYKYDKETDQIVENILSAKAQQELYDRVAYQMAIRTIHELFEADVVNAIDTVVFSAVVTIVNPATGKSELRCIASVSSMRDQFMEFDLGRVDPKATFEHLSGVINGAPADLTTIAPIQDLEKTDKRFL